jgi:3-oxoadipate CoA-transferase alpha subunit
VHDVVELGTLDPEAVVTPGLFVKRVVKVARVKTGAGGIEAQAAAGGPRTSPRRQQR